jgi:hypothetical protein
LADGADLINGSPIFGINANEMVSPAPLLPIREIEMGEAYQDHACSYVRPQHCPGLPDSSIAIRGRPTVRSKPYPSAIGFIIRDERNLRPSGIASQLQHAGKPVLNITGNRAFTLPKLDTARRYGFRNIIDNNVSRRVIGPAKAAQHWSFRLDRSRRRPGRDAIGGAGRLVHIIKLAPHKGEHAAS